ncbi:MAG: histidine phosphatase family protein [Candidatus Gracilibacteria bacterium]|nr:histidine phosphatase family protein [Candidatus Gracilibacteria bacterium]
MKIFAIRHPQTQWNLIRRFQGHLDSPLTDLGIETVNKLADELKNKNITKIISSDLGRCVQTSQIIAKKLNIKNIELDKNLRERNFGIYNGKYKKDIVNIFDEDDYYFIAPEGESCKDMQNRVLTFLNNFKEKFNLEKEDRILIVTHSGILKTLLFYSQNNSFNDKSNKTTQKTICKFSLENNKLNIIRKKEIL